jgi:hypothetical protein
MSNKLLGFDNIMDVICNYYGVSKEDVLAPNRQQELVAARHMFCNMCRSYTNSTTFAIGDYITRHHSSVIFGSNKINTLYEFDKTTRADRDIISEALLGEDVDAPSCNDILDIDWKQGTVTFLREGISITERINKFLNKNYTRVATLNT